MSLPLTETDIETVTFIKNFIEENKLPPTLNDIAEHFSLKDRATARTRVLRLKKKGVIDYSKSQPRSITLTNYDYKLIEKKQT